MEAQAPQTTQYNTTTADIQASCADLLEKIEIDNKQLFNENKEFNRNEYENMKNVMYQIVLAEMTKTNDNANNMRKMQNLVMDSCKVSRTILNDVNTFKIDVKASNSNMLKRMDKMASELGNLKNAPQAANDELIAKITTIEQNITDMKQENEIKLDENENKLNGIDFKLKVNDNKFKVIDIKLNKFDEIDNKFKEIDDKFKAIDSFDLDSKIDIYVNSYYEDRIKNLEKENSDLKAELKKNSDKVDLMAKSLKKALENITDLEIKLLDK